MEITLFSLIYLFTAVVTFLVSMLAWQRKVIVGSTELAYLCQSVSFCAFFLTFEASVTTQEGKVFWSQVSYIGGVLIPVFYYLFTRRFTSLVRLKEMKYGWLLFVFPAVSLLMAFTNGQHHLLWSGYSPIDPNTNMMAYKHGFWFWIGYMLYNYVLLFVATYQLIKFTITNKHNDHFRRQSMTILFAGLLPWVASLFYLLELIPYKGLEVTTISTSISAVIFAWAIIRGRLLNLVPVARETLMETLSLGIIALDDKNRIQDINQVAKEYLGLDPDGLLGLTLEQAINRSNNPVSPAVNLLYDTIIDPLDVQQVTIEIDTGFTAYRVNKKPIKSMRGSRLVTIHDVTFEVLQQKELTAAKLKAEESDKLKSAFLANMSHEIRTPMNSIIGFISLLQEDNLSDSEKSEYLDIVRSNGDRLLSTLNDIVDISKIESGQAMINYSDFDINEVLINSYSLFRQEADMRGLEFVRPAIIMPDKSYIRSDKEKVYSIVTNLIKNALKYTTKGFVKLECSIIDRELFFTVTDSGIGIPRNKQRAIFDRFVQVDSVRKSTFEGAGLGLSITKAFVEMLGGTISLDSVEGQGSSFYIRLRVQEAKPLTDSVQ